MRYGLAAERQPTNSLDIKKPFRIPKRWRGNTQKKNGNTRSKIGENDGGEDLSVHPQYPAEQGTALHQQVFWLKHDAKLRHCYARQLISNVIFFRTAFLRFHFRPNGPNDTLFVVLFAIKKIMTRVTNCFASTIHLNFGLLFRNLILQTATLRWQAKVKWSSYAGQCTVLALNNC